MKRIFCIIIIVISIFTISYAHSGRTDANGGHYDSSTELYHYHNDGYTEEREQVILNAENDNEEVDRLNSKIETLQEQINSKQDTIGKLNNEIDERFYEIERLKDDKKALHFIYWFVIICMGLAIWNMKKENK